MSSITPISNSIKVIDTSQISNAEVKPATTAKDFANILNDAISELNNYQKEADIMKTKLVAGEVNDVHGAMISAEKAYLTLEFAVQVRNKVVEAYQEIMRMQV